MEQQEIEIPVVADAHVREAQPRSNFGTSWTLEAARAADPVFGALLSQSYVRFGSLAAIPTGARVVSARLEMTLLESQWANPVTMVVCRVEASWAETSSTLGPGITWENQPTRTSQTPCVSAAVGADPISYAWDVTAIAQSWADGSRTNYGLSVSPIQDTFSRRAFESRERVSNFRNPPRLVVTYESGMPSISGRIRTDRGCEELGDLARYTTGEVATIVFRIDGVATALATVVGRSPVGQQTLIADRVVADGQEIPFGLRLTATGGRWTLTLLGRTTGANQELARCSFTIGTALTPTRPPTRAPTPTGTTMATAVPTWEPTEVPTSSGTTMATAVPTWEPTPTATPGPATGTLRGRVRLERRDSSAGATVRVGGMAAVTDFEGVFEIANVPIRRHSVQVTHPSYLRAMLAVDVVGGSMTELAMTLLLAGDVDQDGRIGRPDADRIALGWASTPADPRWSPELDITADGVVDIRDAVAVQFNWGTRTAVAAAGRAR